MLDRFIVQVKMVLGSPFLKGGNWVVKVQFISFGHTFTDYLEFKTFEEASKVDVGFEFWF